MKVYVSTVEGATASNDFEETPILEVEQTDDATWYEEIIDLSDYAGQNIHLGFRINNVTTLEDGWFIDDVSGLEEPVTETSIKRKTNTLNYNVYPNPVRNMMHISNLNNARVEVFDILGRKAIEFINVQADKSLDVSALRSGIYVVKVTENNNFASFKVNVK